jgi:plasmid replication initiation protein
MNLADFPISALQRAQKSDGAGHKVSRMELSATRYDPATRQRVQQKVTLTSSASDGLPTPADEHVILALLFVAKHSDNFAENTVHFSPPQLFEIMGWAPNGRSYTRLRDVLRRLKSLTVRYENAWWDASGRAYEEELATGIISAYRIGRQVSGPRKAGSELASWATWTPQFFESLKAGNLKRIDLETFFKLRTPTAQRMYRFLDKRFYNSPALQLDLVEFACGHVGLTDAGNVALLKRRLAPGLEELEEIGFLASAPAEGRFQKVKAGQWRIVLQAARQAAPEPVTQAEAVAQGPEVELACEFYRLWGGTVPTVPGVRDVEQTRGMIAERGADEAKMLIEALVRITRKNWPDCRSLSGAAQKYLPDAMKARQGERKRAETRERSARQRQQQQQAESKQQQSGQALQAVWEALPEGQKRAIEEQVRQRVAGPMPAAFVHRLCLEELSRRLG